PSRSLVLGDDVQRGREGGVDYATPGAARRRRGDAEEQRFLPGVAGHVDVAVRIAAGEPAVEGEGQRAALRGEVGISRFGAVPDDVGPRIDRGAAAAE